MKRTHRTVHRWVWPCLAILLSVLVTLAFVWRPPPEDKGERAQTAVTEHAA